MFTRCPLPWFVFGCQRHARIEYDLCGQPKKYSIPSASLESRLT